MGYPYEPGFPGPPKDTFVDKKELLSFAETMLGRLRGEFDYWSERLSAASLQLNLGVIGAHWAVWGSMDLIKTKPLAVWSLVFVGSGVLFNLWFATALAELLYKRHLASAADDDEWNRECQNCWDYSGKPRGSTAHMALHARYRHFPSTPKLDRLAKWFRWVRCAFPTLGALLFFLSVLLSSGPGDPPKPGDSTAGTTLTYVGSLSGFASGDTLVSEAAISSFRTGAWANILTADTAGRVSFIVVGHVDKRLLKPTTRRIYGSNEALALARARMVKRIMLTHTTTGAHVGLEERIITLSSSAMTVGIEVDSANMAMDRSVHIYALRNLSRK